MGNCVAKFEELCLTKGTSCQQACQKFVAPQLKQKIGPDYIVMVIWQVLEQPPESLMILYNC